MRELDRIIWQKKDGTLLTLSDRFLDQRNAWDNLEDLKNCYLLKYSIYEMIEEETDQAMLRSFVEDLTEIEFEIQTLWGYEPDARFHRFWETSKCTCPVLDNIERYGTGYAVIGGDCPLHKIEGENESN